MTDSDQREPAGDNLIPAIIIALGLALGGYFVGARQEMVMIADRTVIISGRFGELKSCDDVYGCQVRVKGQGWVDEDPAPVAAPTADPAATAAAAQ